MYKLVQISEKLIAFTNEKTNVPLDRLRDDIIKYGNELLTEMRSTQ
jgi:hypothetical protein